MKRIFIIGQCTLHWGRMEFGNIGNYYIIDSFFDELRKVFPDDIIVTTMQFSQEFYEKYQIESLPMELYYDFNKIDNLKIAQHEFECIKNGISIGSGYVDEVKKADLVIDFSGDIWGDNADFLGEDRFETGCYKDLTAQLLRPTVMLAGSPGPFKSKGRLSLGKAVYAGFSLVTNREQESIRLLKKLGFDLSKTSCFPCPSFLFEKASDKIVMDYIKDDRFLLEQKIKIGIILCGWNFQRGPFNAWPREDYEYDFIVHTIEILLEKNDVHIYLLSHANGFEIPPAPFALKHGRDFQVVKQLNEILMKKGYGSSQVTLLESVYPADVTKGIIGHFDILISGRMHGAVAGISQCIPTIMIDYGHEPKAHKIKGFAEIAGLQEFVVDVNDEAALFKITQECVKNREKIRYHLSKRMVRVKKEAAAQFEQLKNIIG